MSPTLDHTHDPGARSWVESANGPDSDFPLQNLPLGVCRRAGTGGPFVIATAIGDDVLDLRGCADAGLLDDAGAAVADACREPALNALMALGVPSSLRLRHRLFALLAAGGAHEVSCRTLLEPHLWPATRAEHALPALVGDYTDFYASIHHATNVGRMMRPDNPLLPNYRWVPIGYHGRASSLVVSGTPIRRPAGQTRPEGAPAPVFGPTRRLDYELEVGAFIGPGNAHGTIVPIGEAESHVFGLCLVNDWSARDVQAWEYQPLGPFLSKSFATTVSPWVVTMQALAPYRVPAAARGADDPAPLPHLASDDNVARGGLDVTLEVWLQSEHMRQAGQPAVRLSRGLFREMYWTIAQLVTHHASNGCNLRPGDLIASGTISGSAPDARGCLLERAWRGEQPVPLTGGESRAFLQDGDEVIFRAWCEAPGARRIGFGDCRGRIVPGVS
jgi:fumarylacetoacetase